ncbi:hypothetical protein D3C75_573930 [compost metagenome]
MERIGGFDDIIIKKIAVSFPPPDVIPLDLVRKIEGHRIVIRDVGFLLMEPNGS